MLGIIVTYPNLFPTTFQNQLMIKRLFSNYMRCLTSVLLHILFLQAGILSHSLTYSFIHSKTNKRHISFSFRGPSWSLPTSMKPSMNPSKSSLISPFLKNSFGYRVIYYEICSWELKTLALSLNPRSATCQPSHFPSL